jgi:hypothetical protein
MSDFPTSYQDPSFEDPSKSTTITIVINSADADSIPLQGLRITHYQRVRKGYKILGCPGLNLILPAIRRLILTPLTRPLQAVHRPQRHL